MPSKPQFFATTGAWRAWLEKYHDKKAELSVGFYKRDSGRPSITWPEAVDGALCFGWIDGVRHSIDEVSYRIRFTPRKPRSIWSAVNVKRATDLSTLGLMHAAGLAAFAKREGKRSEIYAYEQRTGAKLTAAYVSIFQKNQAAWQFFQSQPPWYRRTASWWVISAKREETRLKRLATLIDDSAQRRNIKSLTRTPKK